jgi:hypothetical protein
MVNTGENTPGAAYPGINGGLTPRRGATPVEKVQVPGVGWLAYMKDPEGNIFGLLQPAQ